jgi:SAM-dependent methyltransferase
MYDPVEVHALFAGHVARLAPYWPSPLGVTATELGPGNSLAQAVLWNLLGVERVLAVDVQQYASAESAPGVYQGVIESLPARIDEGKLPDPLGPEGRASRVDELFPGGDLAFPVLGPRIDYRVTDGRNLPLESDTVGLIYSISVLEHVRDTEHLYREMYRVLRSGGLCSHIIDLRDHHHPEPLDFLRYPDGLWDCMTGRSAGWTNRLRASDHLRLIEAAGLRVHLYDPRYVDEAPSPGDLDARFQGLASDDLRTVAMILILGKP